MGGGESNQRAADSQNSGTLSMFSPKKCLLEGKTEKLEKLLLETLLKKKYFGWELILLKSATMSLWNVLQ